MLGTYDFDVETDKRKPISKKIRDKILARVEKDKLAICPYCYGRLRYNKLDVCHVYPVGMYGDTLPTKEIVVAHRDCNRRAGMSMLQFNRLNTHIIVELV